MSPLRFENHWVMGARSARFSLAAQAGKPMAADENGRGRRKPFPLFVAGRKKAKGFALAPCKG